MRDENLAMAINRMYVFFSGNENNYRQNVFQSRDVLFCDSTNLLIEVFMLLYPNSIHASAYKQYNSRVPKGKSFTITLGTLGQF